MKDKTDKLKTQEERLKECIVIAKALDENGITKTEFPERKELDIRMNDYVKTGDAWTGQIKFPALHRIADVILSRKKNIASSVNLRFVLNPALANVKSNDKSNE